MVKNSPARVAWEESILIYAFIKWLLLASIAGALAGGVSCFFVKSLDWAIAGGQSVPGPFRLMLLPLGIVASTLIVKYMAPDARGHGTEKVIEAIHERSGRISVKVIPVKLVTTIITVASGGSAGKEGPAAQIGAGVTSTLATILRFSDVDRKKLVVCGISAGFAAVFGTPMAGALFGLEVLYIGQVFYDVLFPSIISGIVSYKVALSLGMSYGGLNLLDIPPLSPTMSMWLLLAGVFFGLVSFVHIELMAFFERLFSRVRLGLVGKALLGSCMLLGLGVFLGDSYYGLGLETLDLALEGGVVPSLAFLWKSLMTAITLSCGGSGGVVTPIFFIGATSGVAFASLFGLNGALFGPLGFAGVLAGCANAPISATVMAMELFGGEVGVMAAIVSVSAFFLVGHRSVYPSQRLARSKSPMIAVRRRPCRVDQGRSVPLVDQSVFFSSMVCFWKCMESRFNLRAPERFRKKER
ncbi:MAG: voltage-gated chloride channel [Synergistales bacterium]|nr:voltage-gated chloride channel [Synergistales bacterium]